MRGKINMPGTIKTRWYMKECYQDFDEQSENKYIKSNPEKRQ